MGSQNCLHNFRGFHHLSLWLFFKCLLFFLDICVKNALPPCFSRLVTKEEMCGKKFLQTSDLAPNRTLRLFLMVRPLVTFSIRHTTWKQEKFDDFFFDRQIGKSHHYIINFLFFRECHAMVIMQIFKRSYEIKEKIDLNLRKLGW